MRILFTHKKEDVSIKFGLLYNRYAIQDSRLIAPSGWHVPTEAEGSTLVTYLGSGADAAKALRIWGDGEWWQDFNDCTNSSGFNMKGAGRRAYNSGLFYSMHINGYVMFSGTTFFWRNLAINTANNLTFSNARNTEGRPFRFIKNDSTNPGTVLGNDGTVYPTVKIGTQVWLAENSKETKFQNGDPIPEVTGNAAWAALTSSGMCAYNNDWNNV